MSDSNPAAPLEPPESRHEPDSRWLWLGIALASLIGTGLRLATAPHFDFYGDEFWTIRWARSPVGEIFDQFGVMGLTMHLYILFIKGWASVVGFSPFMMKLPSLIAGVALIPLVFWVGKRWLDAHTAALAAVMIALNFQVILHSRNARVYTILAVVAVLAMWLFLRALSSGSIRDLLASSLINATALALSVHAAYLLPVQGAVLLVELLSRRLSLRQLMSFAASMALTVVLTVLFYHRAFDGIETVASHTGVADSAKITYAPWLPNEKLWVPFRVNHLLVPELMLALLALGSGIAWRQHQLPGRLLVFWALLPSLVYYLQRAPLQGSSIARYVLPALPAQLLLIALGGLFLVTRLIPAKRWALGGIILLLTAGYATHLGYQRQLITQAQPTEQVVRSIRESFGPNDIVTSFPGHLDTFLKLHFGDSAITLPALIHNRRLRPTGRLIIVTDATRQTAKWWRPNFEIETIGGPRYASGLFILRSKNLRARPRSLRLAIERFYFAFLNTVANGDYLVRNPRVHRQRLASVHLRLSQLTKRKERKEHLRLQTNPRAWKTGMSEYPNVLERLDQGARDKLIERQKTLKKRQRPSG